MTHHAWFMPKSGVCEAGQALSKLSYIPNPKQFFFYFSETESYYAILAVLSLTM